MLFDRSKPTVQMLGRYQPWHAGHRALFERCIAKTGQVVIMVRETPRSDKDPFTVDEVMGRIYDDLAPKYIHGQHYLIISVPNIVNITYGRDVGYTIDKEEFTPDIEAISATKIRSELASKQGL